MPRMLYNARIGGMAGGNGDMTGIGGIASIGGGVATY